VNLLLTGRPGIGKTTAIMRTLELLEGYAVTGFYTRELRGRRGRLGFEAVTLNGRRQTLAHVEFRGRHRVSRYGVDVAGFETEIVPAIDPLLHPDADLIVVDEIGKMECFSARFQEAVLRALGGEVPVLGTVGLGGHPFIRQVRARDDVEMIQITARNRDLLPQRLAQDCVPATSML